MTTIDSLAERLRRTARSVCLDELEQAARLMAAAFDTDPSIRYLLGGMHEGRDDWCYFLTVLRALYGRCLMLTSGLRLLLRSMHYEANCARIKRQLSTWYCMCFVVQP